MEIRLKTAEEFRSAHVTIEIRATPEEAIEVSQRLFTSDEVGHYQATEAELVATPLRQRIAELEKTLAESRELVDFKTRVADQMDRDKDKLWARVREERERSERHHADAVEAERKVRELERRNSRLVEEANAQEARHDQERKTDAQSIAARDRLLEAASTRVRMAKEILGATPVSRARDEIVTSKGAVLADAISNALDALSA
jgi:hypothetical protein